MSSALHSWITSGQAHAHCSLQSLTACCQYCFLQLAISCEACAGPTESPCKHSSHLCSLYTHSQWHIGAIHRSHARQGLPYVSCCRQSSWCKQLLNGEACVSVVCEVAAIKSCSFAWIIWGMCSWLRLPGSLPICTEHVLIYSGCLLCVHKMRQASSTRCFTH